MNVIKFNSKRADELAKKLTKISDKAGQTGYLVGLIQDVSRCIKANLELDDDKDLGDERAIREISDNLINAENLLSALLSTAILRGKGITD